MRHQHWNWTAVLVAALLVVGCAPKAAEKMQHAEQDVAQAWEAERNAAVAEMKKGLAATERQIEMMRTRAAELEADAEEEAAKLWHRAADELEEARDVAARDIEALENAGADAVEAAKGAAAEAMDELDRAERRVAHFAAETKDEFVAGARAFVDETERDLAWAKEQLAEAGEEAAKEWHEAVDALEAKHQAAVAELAKIEKAEHEAWADMKHGFIAAYHDLRDASERASEHLSEV